MTQRVGFTDTTCEHPSVFFLLPSYFFLVPVFYSPPPVFSSVSLLWFKLAIPPFLFTNIVVILVPPSLLLPPSSVVWTGHGPHHRTSTYYAECDLVHVDNEGDVLGGRVEAEGVVLCIMLRTIRCCCVLYTLCCCISYNDVWVHHQVIYPNTALPSSFSPRPTS